MPLLTGGAINPFERQLGHLVPIHKNDVLSGSLFVLVGKMILHSILNDCNGVPDMSPAIISCLMTGRRDSAVEHVTLEDIPDPDLKENLKEVNVSVYHYYKTYNNIQMLGSQYSFQFYLVLEIKKR